MPELTAAARVREIPPAAERRAHVRHPSAALASCGTGQGEEGVAWTALIRDVSARGIGLVLPQRFEPGAVLLVEPFALTGHAARPLPARVVRAAARDDGLWLLGCAFVGELGEDEVSALAQGAADSP